MRWPSPQQVGLFQPDKGTQRSSAKQSKDDPPRGDVGMIQSAVGKQEHPGGNMGE